MRDIVLPAPMQAYNATKGGKQDGGDPAAAPHGETVHVHIGAGSLLCRPGRPPTHQIQEREKQQVLDDTAANAMW